MHYHSYQAIEKNPDSLIDLHVEHALIRSPQNFSGCATDLI